MFNEYFAKIPKGFDGVINAFLKNLIHIGKKIQTNDPLCYLTSPELGICHQFPQHIQTLNNMDMLENYQKWENLFKMDEIGLEYISKHR